MKTMEKKDPALMELQKMSGEIGPTYAEMPQFVGPDQAWLPHYIYAKHMHALDFEITERLAIDLVEVKPDVGTVINMGESFKAQFRLFVKPICKWFFGNYVRFEDVKVVFKPGMYAKLNGQNTFTFPSIDTLHYELITVDFIAKDNIDVTEGPEYFTRVCLTGRFDPACLFDVHKEVKFATQIELG